MTPTPYSVRWTSKLICRDIKSVAARCTRKARGLFSRAVATDASVSTFDTVQAEFDLPMESITSFDDAHATQECSPAVPFTLGNCDSATPSVSEQGQKTSNTLYHLLTANLKESYSLRDRDLPMSERWAFRGAWLLLHMATQFCSSNPSYMICSNIPSPDEATLLLEVLRKFTVPPAKHR